MATTGQPQASIWPPVRWAAKTGLTFTGLATAFSALVLYPLLTHRATLPPGFKPDYLISLIWGPAGFKFIASLNKDVLVSFPWSLLLPNTGGVGEAFTYFLQAVLHLSYFCLGSIAFAWTGTLFRNWLNRRLKVKPREPRPNLLSCFRDSLNPTLIFLGLLTTDHLIGLPFLALGVNFAIPTNLSWMMSDLFAKMIGPTAVFLIALFITWLYIPTSLYVWRRWKQLLSFLAEHHRQKRLTKANMRLSATEASMSGGLLNEKKKDAVIRVIGQDQAIKKVDSRLKGAALGLNLRPGRPKSVFLFLGPTGVGKTETAKWIAQCVFGSEENMVRVNMEEHQNEASAWSLTGSPRGYIGSEEGGQLTQALKKASRGVLLLDEIEKGHPKLLDLFMGAFDEGKLTDRSSGEVISLADTVVVMTSNLMADRWQELQAMTNEGLLDTLAIQGALRREFLGRVDEVVVFSALPIQALEEIVVRRLGNLAQNLSASKHYLVWDPALPKFLLESLGQGNYGARQAEQAVMSGLGALITDAIHHKAASAAGAGGKLPPRLRYTKVYAYPNAAGEIKVTFDEREWESTARWTPSTAAEGMAARRSILRDRVIGQDQALDQLERHAMAAAKGLRVLANKPMLSVLLLGPTGVGKTETAKALAEMFFGSPSAILRLDMGQFNGPLSCSRLFGNPKGVDGGGEGGELTKSMRAKPKSLVLLDEVEKADPGIWDPLMTVFDEGYLQEAGSGRQVSFRESVVVMTSNIMADKAEWLASLSSEDLNDVLAATGVFRKEMLGRFDRILVYRNLPLEAIRQIAERRMRVTADTVMGSLGLEIKWTPGVVETISLLAGQARYGVRRLDQIIKDHVLLTLSDYVDSLGGEGKAKGARAYLRLERGGKIGVFSQPGSDDTQATPGAYPVEWRDAP